MDSCHIPFQIRITVFLLVCWYFLVLKHSTLCQEPPRMSLVGVGCLFPRPAWLWCGCSLGSGGCAKSHARAAKSYEKPHHSIAPFFQGPPFKLSLCILSRGEALLCPAMSLAEPDPLDCLPGQASDLPSHPWISLMIVDHD